MTAATRRRAFPAAAPTPITASRATRSPGERRREAARESAGDDLPPGHYRIALAVNSPAELPVDPKATTKTGRQRGSAIGVGRDHESGRAAGARRRPVPAQAKADAPLETDVTLPNINCKRCTLQVIQFMEQHGLNNPGQYTYHHCATMQITADPKKPIDAAWPKERQGT